MSPLCCTGLSFSDGSRTGKWGCRMRSINCHCVIACFLAAGLSSAATAQQTEHRAYGARVMGGLASARPAVAPPWPSAVPRPGIDPPTPSSSSWQHRPRTQPVSLAPSRFQSTPPRRVVAFAHPYPPGALVIVNRERALYHVLPDGRAVRYPVAIGSFTEEWTGFEPVTDKKINPTWFPVPEPGKEPREPVAGGDPANPLGVRALYLGRTLWRIHGTPAVELIGRNVSNGCIRMLNEHVTELYDQVMLGTEVYAIDRLADAPPAHRGKKVIE